MKNTGVLFANDIKKERLPVINQKFISKALKFNLMRMGINNTVVTNYDGRKFPKVMTNFDRILLDAPCTGLGIISRDP
jgi:ribosomal RNA methyltransferase Nop2